VKKFADSTGTEWEIDLPFGEMLRVASSSERKFDLLEPTLPEERPLQKLLMDNLPLFWEVLWHLLEPQAALVMPTADELRRRGNGQAIPSVPGITAAEFGRRMAGRCLVTAQRAFFDEWRDFFHSIDRPDQAVAIDATIMMQNQILQKVSDRLANEPALQQLPTKTGEAIDSALSTAFSELRDALAAIPTATPGGDSTNSTKEVSATHAAS
jgi:hypothetical protein